MRWGFILCGIDPEELEGIPSFKDGKPPYPIDRTVASLLGIFSSYVLPMMFGLLGTLIAVIRSVQRKVQTSRLAPSDLMLTLIGLPIGAVAGVAVGLFLNPSVLNLSSTVGNVTLTASGLGFLAGYGAEAFFRFVDFQIIERVFAATTPKDGQSTNPNSPPASGPPQQPQPPHTPNGTSPGATGATGPTGGGGATGATSAT